MGKQDLGKIGRTLGGKNRIPMTSMTVSAAHGSKTLPKWSSKKKEQQPLPSSTLWNKCGEEERKRGGVNVDVVPRALKEGVWVERAGVGSEIMKASREYGMTCPNCLPSKTDCRNTLTGFL